MSVPKNGWQVGILTYHNADNLGAVLQAYALQRFLNRLDNVSARVVDYRCPVIEGTKRIQSRSIKGLCKAVPMNAYYKVKGAGFDKFRREHLRLTERSYTPDSVKALARRFDLLITGSDQVWNLRCSGNDWTYFLDFADDHTKKCSYAASLGNYRFEQEDGTQAAQLLNRLDRISVREQSAAQELERLGIPGAQVHLDPVFLLSREEWLKAASGRMLKEKYIFVYLIQEDVNVMRAAESYAKKHGCKLISNKKSPEFILHGGPGEFLSWLNNAEAVFTNSFHGTAFSVIFEKPLCADIALRSGEKNMRVLELLESIGGESGILKTVGQSPRLTYDYDRLEEKIGCAKEYLQELITLLEPRPDSGQRFFAACHRRDSVWKESSSGGAFTALTDQWLKRHGDKAVIYGCAWGENLQVRHIRATDAAGRDAMRGSKYIGSRVGDSYRLAAEDLRSGKAVLFSGTPCQIAGLKRYLQIRGLEPEDRLLTVEVICHGVASDKFFRDYIAHLEGRYGGKAVACNFRSKSRPGKIQDMSVEFDNGKVYQAASTKFDWFYSAYNARNLILRPSCYQCRYARPEREADVSLGDHWGDQSGGKARSLIIANTQQGLLWTQRLGRDMVLEKLQPQQVHQDRLHSPCKKPESYDRFWEIYEQKGYLAAQEFLGNNTPKGKAKSLAAAMTVRLGLDRAAKKLKKR